MQTIDKPLARAALAALLVLLSLSCSSLAQDNNESGQLWGGEGVSLQMTGSGATLEFDCAHGAILQGIQPNAQGEFKVTGTYTPERGGPIQKNNPPRDLPATYKGSISGHTMHLQIVLGQDNEAPPPFTLTQGAGAHLRKCR